MGENVRNVTMMCISPVVCSKFCYAFTQISAILQHSRCLNIVLRRPILLVIKGVEKRVPVTNDSSTDLQFLDQQGSSLLVPLSLGYSTKSHKLLEFIQCTYYQHNSTIHKNTSY